MDYNDRILDFLSGDISKEDQKKLAEDLNNNDDLQEDFKLQKEILHTIKMGDDDTLDFRSQLKDIGGEFLNEKNSRLRIRPAYWLAAASVITLLSVSTFLGLFRSDKYVGDQMFLEYYEPYGINIQIRGDHAEEDITKAISLYQAGNTEKALKEFERLKIENSEMSGFFLALCEIELGNIEEAQKELEKIGKNAIFYSDHINWYLSLCYLKQEEISKAKTMFEEIAKGNNEYSDKAARILKKL